MGDPSRVRISGPLAVHAAGFAADLAQRGYATSSVASHLRLAAHVSRWLDQQGLDFGSLTLESADAFLVHRRAGGHRTRLSRKALAPLLAYLRAVGAAPVEAVTPAATAVEGVLDRYAGYLREERGLAATTIARNVELARPFLSDLDHDGRMDLRALTATEVMRFVIDHSQLQPRRTARVVGALRSLLRFLHADGITSSGLADSLPAVAAWKLSGLPKALPKDQVAALLASCDRNTAVGRRDLAILTVLSRLGLRAGEAARLRLEDLDWRNAEITVTGKGNRAEKLPLPVDVGEVIVSYLTDGRPDTHAREVFVRARGPHTGISRNGLSMVVASAATRAGLGTVHAHHLRHSAATAMVDAGASLDEIGQVLRHRDALTTALYAKVDITALRTVARTWPGAEAAA
jgi:site-specific recombinase XerD